MRDFMRLRRDHKLLELGGSSGYFGFHAIKRCLTGSKSPRAPPHFLADNLSDLNAAQGLYAVSYQMQELLPLYLFNLTTFHIDENESRHVVGDFKLGFARNLDVNPFGHFAPR
jgi:hypothetical protein